MELPGCLFFENKQKTFKLKSRPRGQPRILRKVSIKFNTYLRASFRLLLRIFFSKIGYFSWMNFRNSKNNLSRYTNGLVFTKAGEYGEFFYLRELVCNLWQVMSSVVKPHNTSEDIRHKTWLTLDWQQEIMQRLSFTMSKFLVFRAVYEKGSNPSCMFTLK